MVGQDVTPETGLFERAQELAAIDAAVTAATGSAGGFTILEGPAGIGKTSLLAEARARAADAGMRVLEARASELESAFSFGVVRQLFEPVLARAPEKERSKMLEGAAANAGRLFSSDAPAVGAELE